MDADFKIAGRKRYPVHKGDKTVKTEDTGNENVGTTFTPLDTGVVFEGKLRYHNLKKVELGAMLSALTFHNTPNTFHNIGMARSLGYGKIELKINGIENIELYLKEFELYLTEQIIDWKDSIQLKELLAMVTEQNNSGNSELKYMKLRDFADSKSKKKAFLKYYSELNNIRTVEIKTLIDEETIMQHKAKQSEIENQRKAMQKEKDDWQKAKVSNTVQALEHFVSTYAASSYIDEAKILIETIKIEEEKEKVNALQEESDEKWNSLQAYLKNEKLKEKKIEALDKYIADYPDSKYIVDADKQKDDINNKNKASNKGLDELSNVTDSKNFKSLLDTNNSNLEDNKVLIKENVIRVYNSLNKKKQKSFFKEIQLARFFNKDFESEVKNEVGAK
jgi:hypothetical protein